MENTKKKEIICALDKAFQSVGAKSVEDGCNTVATVFEKLAAELRQLDSREKALAFLDLLPPLKPHEETLVLGAIHYMPNMMRYALKNLSSIAAVQLPSAPFGRPAVNSNTRREVCAYVLDLFGKKVPLHAAKVRAAARYGVSTRTVERIWKARDEEQLPSFGEVLSALSIVLDIVPSFGKVSAQ